MTDRLPDGSFAFQGHILYENLAYQQATLYSPDGIVTFYDIPLSEEDKETIEALGNTIYLFDPTGSGHPSQLANCFTLSAGLPYPPPPSHHSFFQHFQREVYMPFWTHLELTCLADYLPKTHSQHLNERFEKCGGIPHVLWREQRWYENYTRGVETDISRILFDKAAFLDLPMSLLPNTFRHLFHYRVSDDYQSYSVYFVSNTVRKQALTRSNKYNELCAILERIGVLNDILLDL